MKKIYALLIAGLLALSALSCASEAPTGNDPANESGYENDTGTKTPSGGPMDDTEESVDEEELTFPPEDNISPVFDTDGNPVSSGKALVIFDGEAIPISAAYLIDGVTARVNGGVFEVDSGEENRVAFLVINGGKLYLQGTEEDPVIIRKTGAAPRDEELDYTLRDFGVNAAVLAVGTDSVAEMMYGEVYTDAIGGNAFFSADSASVMVGNTRIETSGSVLSSGFSVSFRGALNAFESEIHTLGEDSPALYAGQEGGSIKVSDMKLHTEGAKSPLIRTKGTVSVTNAEGVSEQAQMAVVEGSATARVEDSVFSGRGDGHLTGTSESDHSPHFVDSAGIFIYGTELLTEEADPAYFIGRNSVFTLTGIGRPLFEMTNIKAELSLSGSTLERADGGDYLIVAEETSLFGMRGACGAQVTVSTETAETVDKAFVFRGKSSARLDFFATDGAKLGISFEEDDWGPED